MAVVVMDSHKGEERRRGGQLGPPGLEYEMTTTRKQTIAWQLSFIVGINTLGPTLIFFLHKHLAAKYGVNPALTYTWVTLALGTIELFQWPYRTYLLSRHNFARSGWPMGVESSGTKETRWRSTVRGLITRQDTFGCLFLSAIVIGAVLLTLCCSLGGTRGSFPLLVMAIPSIVLFLGLYLFLTSICTAAKLKTPFAMSSLASNQPFRPAVYHLIEDIVAVEGGGGYAFRMRISHRYEASPPFQRLTLHLTLAFSFWALALFLAALGLVVANVMDRLDEDIVYALVVAISLSWSALFAFAAWRYSQWSLSQEKEWWEREKLQGEKIRGRDSVDVEPLACQKIG